MNKEMNNRDENQQIYHLYNLYATHCEDGVNWSLTNAYGPLLFDEVVRLIREWREEGLKRRGSDDMFHPDQAQFEYSYKCYTPEEISAWIHSDDYELKVRQIWKSGLKSPVCFCELPEFDGLVAKWDSDNFKKRYK